MIYRFEWPDRSQATAVGAGPPEWVELDAQGRWTGSDPRLVDECRAHGSPGPFMNPYAWMLTVADRVGAVLVHPAEPPAEEPDDPDVRY